MSLIINNNGEIFIESSTCFSCRNKLAPHEEYILQEDFYQKVKNKNILEKYIRIISDENKKINNKNRNKGVGCKQFIEMCHVIGIICFSWIIDNFQYLEKTIDEFINNENYKLNNIDLSIKTIENEMIYFNKISNIEDANNTKSFISNLKKYWGTENIINDCVNNEDLNKLSSLQEFLRKNNLWRIDILNRFDVGGTYIPNLKSSFYFGTKALNMNIINMVDLGKYRYQLEIDSDYFSWNSKINNNYKEFKYLDISKLLEENISQEDLKNFIVFTYDKSIYNHINEFDKYAKRFDIDFKVYIPYEIKVHGIKFKLKGIISNTGSDGGHDVVFFKVPNQDFWQYIDEFYAIRVYEDKKLNIFNNKNFNHIDLLSDLSVTSNTFLLEKCDE
ncbi:hypothetical protein IOLA_075 [uncultured bacterium]|nr:hypothetical protein IOLA_075 [uncultured bacterium]